MKEISIDYAKEIIYNLPEYKPICLLEKDIGMPKNSLQQFLKGKRKFPKKWIKPFDEYFKRINKIDKGKLSVPKTDLQANKAVHTKECVNVNNTIEVPKGLSLEERIKWMEQNENK